MRYLDINKRDFEAWYYNHEDVVKYLLKTPRQFRFLLCINSWGISHCIIINCINMNQSKSTNYRWNLTDENS